MRSILSVMMLAALTACGDATAKDSKKPAVMDPAAIELEALKTKLGSGVVGKALTEYRKCIAAEIEVAQALDDPIERSEFIAEGQAHCKTRMQTALHIAGNKADMRALTEGLIEAAKKE